MPLTASAIGRPVADFPDIQRKLAGLLVSLVPSSDHIGSRTPAGTFWPYLRIARIGGPRDRVTDYASVDLESFDALYDDAMGRLLAALHLLEDNRGDDTAVLDHVIVRSGPAELPWPNTNVRRIGATVEIDFRRH